MSKVLSALHEDHRNIGRLLGMLTRELDALAGGNGGNTELMRDIMTYMIHFPDHVHHPKEDLMFERMHAKKGLTSGTRYIIEMLLREHAALAKKGQAFHDALRRACDGSAVDRQELLAMGRDYVDFLRHHARLEEETVFVEAGTLLDDADWSVITEAFATRIDPVFGQEVDREFRALYEHIQNSAYLSARREG